MFKKFANAYERIYSPTFHGSSYGVSLYRPISRSFFKPWEILHDFEPDLRFGKMANEQRAVRAAFLAEGPGGFMEAFAKYRYDYRTCEGGKYHGITLVDRSSRNVPGWRITPIRRFARSGNAGGVWVQNGEDGTGNLYNICNVDNFVAAVGGKGTVDFVTADGGFDFSGSFNHQEERAMHLVVTQLYTAMCLQKHNDGGSHSDDDDDDYTLTTLRKICEELVHAPFEEHENIINTRFVENQICAIENVITLIGNNGNERNQQLETTSTLIASSLEHSIKWCVKYNIPHIVSTETTRVIRSTKEPEPQAIRSTNEPEPQAIRSTNEPEPQAIRSTNEPEPQAISSTNEPEPQAIRSTNEPEPQAIRSTNEPEPQAIRSTNEPEPQAIRSTNEPEPQPEKYTAIETHQTLTLNP
eukprot:gene17308-23617_t